MSSEVIWHDVECGGYAADLVAWRGLADDAAGPILELGCGAGRVCLDLARAGHEVTGVDRSPALVAELRRRATAAKLELVAEVADVRRLELGRDFSLVLAPMQLAHLFGAGGRASLLRGAAAHLRAGGRVAVALLAAGAVDGGTGGTPPLPDVRELDGWVYSSQPIDVRATENAIEVRRLRQTVSPEGALSEEVDVTRLAILGIGELESEARDAGLALSETMAVEETSDHVGSQIVILEAT
jgi:SAM-dependent methyltransferase